MIILEERIQNIISRFYYHVKSSVFIEKSRAGNIKNFIIGSLTSEALALSVSVCLEIENVLRKQSWFRIRGEYGSQNLGLISIEKLFLFPVSYQFKQNVLIYDSVMQWVLPQIYLHNYMCYLAAVQLKDYISKITKSLKIFLECKYLCFLVFKRQKVSWI